MKSYVASELTETTNNMTVEQVWTKIKTSISKGVGKFISSKVSKHKKPPPYISADLTHKMSLKDRLSKKGGKAGPQKRYSDLKCTCQLQLRREHNRYVENLITDDNSPSNVSKKFGSYLKN